MNNRSRISVSCTDSRWTKMVQRDRRVQTTLTQPMIMYANNWPLYYIVDQMQRYAWFYENRKLLMPSTTFNKTRQDVSAHLKSWLLLSKKMRICDVKKLAPVYIWTIYRYAGAYYYFWIEALKCITAPYNDFNVAIKTFWMLRKGNLIKKVFSSWKCFPNIWTKVCITWTRFKPPAHP